jgi:periplasmic divalent cation tolerance protein
MTGACVIQCAAGSMTEAEAIADRLLERRLAACVQLSAIASRYVWKGEVARDDEVLLSIKTRAELFEAVRAEILALHSYETPEVIALQVTAADAEYLAWLAESTG